MLFSDQSAGRRPCLLAYHAEQVVSTQRPLTTAQQPLKVRMSEGIWCSAGALCEHGQQVSTVVVDPSNCASGMKSECSPPIARALAHVCQGTSETGSKTKPGRGT